MNGEEWDTRDNVSRSVTVGSNRFEVTHFKGCAEWGPGHQAPYTEYWLVSVPADYDEFDVASSRISHADVVGQMETFIADAKLALEALKGMT